MDGDDHAKRRCAGIRVGHRAPAGDLSGSDLRPPHCGHIPRKFALDHKEPFVAVDFADIRMQLKAEFDRQELTGIAPPSLGHYLKRLPASSVVGGFVPRLLVRKSLK